MMFINNNKYLSKKRHILQSMWRTIIIFFGRVTSSKVVLNNLSFYLLITLSKNLKLINAKINYYVK